MISRARQNRMLYLAGSCLVIGVTCFVMALNHHAETRRTEVSHQGHDPELALAAMQTRDWQKAIGHFQDAAVAGNMPNAAALARIGECNIYLGNLDQAAGIAEQLTAQGVFGKGRAAWLRGLLAEKQGDRSLAMKEYNAGDRLGDEWAGLCLRRLARDKAASRRSKDK